MIDWVTLLIKFTHPRIKCGHVIKLDKDGEVLVNFPTTERFTGSHESSIAIASNDIDFDGINSKVLFIDGNLAKFLQGHNIVGTDDLNLLVHQGLLKICNILNIHLTQDTVHRIRSGDYIVKRIDITNYYELGTHANVGQFLDAAAKKSRTRSGRAITNKGTVYFNKHSKRWAFKFYSKFDEIINGDKGHGLHNDFLNSPMLEWCRTKVRAELVLRKLELLKIAQNTHKYAKECYGKDLCPNTIKNLFNEYMEKIDMSAQATLYINEIEDLPPVVLGTYHLWRAGHDVRKVVSKATFYRHKTILMESADIDISLPALDATDPVLNVIPIRKVIEMEFVQTPESFKRLQLVVN